jgi:hypothetical protein
MMEPTKIDATLAAHAPAAKQQQAQTLEKQVAALQEENAALKKRLSEFEKQEAAKAALEEFVECHGGLFKRKPTGGYHLTVYCPRCRGPMFSLMGEKPFHCESCKMTLNFTGERLLRVMAELP